MQNYQPVTLKLLDADDDLPIKKQSPAVLQEVKVHVHNSKKQGIEIIEISSKSHNVISTDQNTHEEEEKCDVKSIKKLREKATEKHNVQEVGKGDVTCNNPGRH